MINTKINELNSKIDSMEERLNKRIDEEVTVIKNKINLDLAEQNKRLEDVEGKINATHNLSLDLRLSELERVLLF